MSGYPYATINAFNWMAALGGNWKGLDETVLLGITWQQLGWFNILLVTAGLAYFAVRSAGAAASRRCCWRRITASVCSRWPTVCRERYMVPGVLLTLLAAAHGTISAFTRPGWACSRPGSSTWPRSTR